MFKGNVSHFESKIIRWLRCENIHTTPQSISFGNRFLPLLKKGGELIVLSLFFLTNSEE